MSGVDSGEGQYLGTEAPAEETVLGSASVVSSHSINQ